MNSFKKKSSLGCIVCFSKKCPYNLGDGFFDYQGCALHCKGKKNRMRAELILKERSMYPKKFLFRKEINEFLKG